MTRVHPPTQRWHLPESNYSNVISSWRQQPPEFTAFRCPNWLLFNALHINLCIIDRIAVEVLDQALQSHMRQLHVLDEWLLVLVPFWWQLVLRWIFAARELQRYLKAVTENIVEVLHPSGQVVPVSSVSNAVRECFIAIIAVFHDRMVLSVGTC